MAEPESNHAAAEALQTSPGPVADASVYESTHVHSVYDAIADHFSATRYAPWPLVARFLDGQPGGSVGLDVGCGNGKYLVAAQGGEETGGSPRPFFLASDRSANLAHLAYDKHAHARPGADVCLADSLALPFRTGCADFVICIAVVHHLSTRARRQAAVAELLRCVAPGGPGRAVEGEETDTEETGTEGLPGRPQDQGDSLPRGKVLLYVWALEQATSRRGWTAGGEQDLLVPWVKTSRPEKKKKRIKKESNPGKAGGKTEGDKAGGMTEESRGEQIQQTQQTEKTEKNQPDQPPQQDQPKTFQRYYHLYREGELEEDVKAVGGRVVASGYERDNWWVIADPV